MLDPSNIPVVNLQELLARYIFSRSHVSRQTQRVKAGAFMPPANLEFSVTRHREATQVEIWAVGRSVADETERALRGRADVLAATYISQVLRVDPDPTKGNPNHANVVDWPVNDKPAQKLVAQEIAAVARFVATPET